MAKSDQPNFLKDVKDIQEQLHNIEVVGESGGGMVKITITGHRDAKNVFIENSLLKEDKEVLENLIAAAINDATRKIEVASTAKIMSLSNHLGLSKDIKTPDDES